jgi:hypothetical protein
MNLVIAQKMAMAGSCNIKRWRKLEGVKAHRIRRQKPQDKSTADPFAVPEND